MKKPSISFWRQFGIYHLRWQLSNFIIGPLMWLIFNYYKLPYLVGITVMALIGATIFFFIDRIIFKKL